MLDKISDTTKLITGTISAIALIGGISWGMAVWVSKSDVKGVKTDKLEIKMDEVQKAIVNQKRSQDSLKTAVINYAQKSDALQRSYVLYVQEHSKDITELTHSLQGMTFELVQPEINKSEEKSSVKPSAKIRITPIKK